MRKILVLALMVALIPFATGCRLFGDYDNSGSNATTTTTATNVTLKAAVTMTGTDIDVTGSAIPTAKIMEKELYIKIGGVQIGPFGTDGQPSTKSGTAATNWIYNFLKKVTATSVTVTSGNAVLQVYNSTGQFATGTVPVSQIGGTTDNATNTYGITLTSANGKWTVTVSYTAPDGTAAPSVSQPTPDTVLTVESLGYSADNVTYYPLVNATSVPFVSPYVKVTFNTTVSKATDSFSVDFTNAAGTKVTVANTDLGANLAATAATVNSKTELVLQLTGTNANILKPGVTYTATYKS